MSAADAVPAIGFSEQPASGASVYSVAHFWATSVFVESFLNLSPVRWESGKPIWGQLVADSEEATGWNAHWAQLDRSRVIGRLFSIYRRQIRAHCVARYINRYFPARGIFAECGCGSGETSSRLGKERTTIAVDFSEHALRQALRFPVLHAGVLSDIRELPFRDESLDGLWNLGVMEHFSSDNQLLILREFHRVLKPGARMLLWWPPPYGLDHLILRRFGLFPDEPGRLNRQEVIAIAQAAGFDEVRVDFPISDGFTELVLIAEC
jgi:SAM-dependent methyltransferase